MCGGGVSFLRVVVFGQADTDDFRDTGFLHGNPVEHVGGLHGAFVVGDGEELGIAAEVTQHIAIATDVGFIQRGINLVQHYKGTGFYTQHGEEQRQRGERAFSAGELYAGSDYVYPGW